MTPTQTIPKHPHDVTVPWFQSVLDSTGQQGSITGIAVDAVGTGQMATSLRAELSYAPGTDAPASYIVKIASENENSREAGARGAYLKEVRFYQQLAHRVTVRTPAMLASGIDEATNSFFLVLEDLRPARQGDQIEGCSVDQARLAAKNIAGLHGPSWRDRSLERLEWLTVPPEDRPEAHALAQELMAQLTEGFVARYDTRLDAAHKELLRWFAARTGEWLELGLDRFALTHGDHRLDNLLFGTREGGYPVAAVDWQTIALRNPVADISYLLGTGLDPEVRRASECSIVEDYRLALLDAGVSDYGSDQCFDDYRAQTFHALLITVIGSMMTGQTPRGDQMFMAMLHRSARQINDLDARSCLR